MKPKTIIAIIIVTLIVIFSIQNVQIVEVKFLFWHITLSRVLLILGSFIIGILVGVLISMKKRMFTKR